jgi:hypothetical protein
MTVSEKRRILFAGYAPVHALCFLPIYRQLASDPRVDVYLSGGFRQGKGENVTYRLDGFYDPFAVDREKLIPVERLAHEDFDVLVCSHLSDVFFPRQVKKTVQIFHGVSFKNLAVREKALRFDILCLPGRYHADLYRQNGLLRDNSSTFLLTGFPKVDALVSGEHDRCTTLENLGLDPSRRTVLFAPTGEKYNALESMGIEVIWRIAQEQSWNLLVKPHDHPKNKIDWFSELATLENERVKLVRGLDVLPLLNAADVLMTDASSVAVEFTLLDRPIVFLDVPKMFKKVTERAPSLDLETYGRKIGLVVKKPRSIVAALEACMEGLGEESEIRKTMARHVFHRPGQASDNVTGVVLYAAGLSSELPAGVEMITPDREVRTTAPGVQG